jgi:hypothetical protein
MTHDVAALGGDEDKLCITDDERPVGELTLIVHHTKGLRQGNHSDCDLLRCGTL